MQLIKLLPLAALAFSGLATATTPTSIAVDVPSVIVKYDVVNLASVAGVRDLHVRLLAAAETVCAPLQSRMLGLREQYSRCVHESVARGVADVDNVNLTNYHRYRALERVAAN